MVDLSSSILSVSFSSWVRRLHKKGFKSQGAVVLTEHQIKKKNYSLDEVDIILRGELSSLVQARAENTGNLLDERG